MESTRKIYPSLDIAKFVMAMLILLSHTQNEYAADASGIVHNLLAASNFAVPFFFACSGFLFFIKLNSLQEEAKLLYYKSWSLRIGKMYLAWSLIYFSFVAAKWCINGVSYDSLFFYFHRLVVSTSYPTIWFLPALWVGVSITYLLSKKFSNNVLIAISALLYLLCSVGDGYRNVVLTIPVLKDLWIYYMDVFITFRNGVLFGTPFAICGYIIASDMRKTSLKFNIVSAFIFSILFVVESCIIKYCYLSDYSHCGYMLLPATFFIVLSLTQIDIPSKPLFIHFRNLSMLIFLSQRLFLTAIPSVSSSYLSFLNSLGPYSTILFIAFEVIIFSVALEILSKKFKFLHILW